MSLKKRKPSSSPSDNNNTIVVHVETPDPSKDPVVASFPGGLPRDLNNANSTDSDETLKFALRKSRDKSSSKGTASSGPIMLVGKDDTCIYQAQCTGGLGRDEDRRLTKLCVGIYNKRTGRLTLHQAAQEGTVFSLAQTVRSYEEHSALEELPAKMSGADRRRALFESFGSSKKQKVLKSQAANVVNVESVVGAGNVMMGAFLDGQNMSESNRQAMEQAKSGTKEDAVELAYAQARRKFLPTFDKDAKEPHLVYDARDIAGDDAWGQVSRVTDACLAQDNLLAALTSRGHWFDSVLGVVKHVAPESAYAKYQIKCAVLLNHMIHFQQRVVNRRFIRGTADEAGQYLKLPMEIASRFLELFTTHVTDDRGQEGFASSKQTKDKLLVHILLLFLMANGRNMKAANIKPVASDVKIELSEASNLLRAAGCSVKTGSTAVSASLTVPLKFPPPKRGRGGPS